MTDAIRPIHPVWLRATHWFNALAVVLLVMSGWRIYNASPLFEFSFANEITLGGWLGGAILWHFAAMCLLAANGIVYLLCNAATGRLWTQFFPLSPRAFVADLRDALRGRLSHANPRGYDTVQRAAYLFVIVDAVLLVLSGLVLWKSDRPHARRQQRSRGRHGEWIGPGPLVASRTPLPGCLAPR